MKIHPIGVIRSRFRTKEEAPIQGAFQPEEEGTVEVSPEFAPGLKDIETFSHLILIYHFDRAGEVILSLPTFLDDEPHGVFASRHPCRPNGLGLSVVTLLRREGNILHVSGIDVLDEESWRDAACYFANCFNRKITSSVPLGPPPPGVPRSQMKNGKLSQVL